MDTSALRQPKCRATNVTSSSLARPSTGGERAQVDDGGLIVIVVKVKPNARTSALAQEADGSWTAQLKSPPVEGRANDELVTLVARHFGCRKADVSIKSGASGRLKRVVVDPSPSPARGRGPG